MGFVRFTDTLIWPPVPKVIRLHADLQRILQRLADEQRYREGRRKAQSRRGLLREEIEG